MKSKTIILSGESEKGRGILTLFQENNLLQLRIRLYNISKLNRFCKIGIYHNQQVYSANLLEKSGVYTSSIVGDFEIDQDFYTAIIDTKNNNNVILSGGTYAGYFFNDNSVFNDEFSPEKENFFPAKFNENFETEQPNNRLFENIEKENPNTNLYDYGINDIEELKENNPYNNNVNLEEKNKETANGVNFKNHEDCKQELKKLEFETACIDNECDKCKTCKYKEFFYSQNNPSSQDFLQNSSSKDYDELEVNNSQSQAEIKREENSKNSPTILQALIPQFKYVFENYPQDEILTGLLPNSKFVKICENNEEYSIGAIYEENEMKFICYAVKSDYNISAPSELGEHYQWLPLDKEDPLSEGYYVVFQDTQDLKIVEL